MEGSISLLLAVALALTGLIQALGGVHALIRLKRLRHKREAQLLRRARMEIQA